MKLKKIISLVLVFAMMVTVFSAVSVSAKAGQLATVNFVAYNNDGTAVTGNLEAGKTYQIGVKLTNITEKAFKSAQFAIHYDANVIQLVDKSGAAAAKPKDVFIDRDDIYDADEETGYFSKVAANFNATNGLIIYALGIDKDAGVKSVENDGSFEVFKFRVKALKNGKTGISIATSSLGEGKYDLSNPTGVIVTGVTEDPIVRINPVAFRVGDVSYVSGTPAKDVFEATYRLGGKTADQIVSDLNAMYGSVDVTYTDDEGGSAVKTATIAWEAPEDYDADAAGTYVFTGTVTAPEGVNYTGDKEITVKANVTVAKLKVMSPVSISVNAKAGNAPDLPGTVEVTLNDGSKADLSVTWDTVTDTGKGKRTVAGLLNGTDSIDVNGFAATAEITFATYNSGSGFSTVITSNEATVAIDAEDIEKAAEAALPATIYGTYASDEDYVYRDVSAWTQTTTTPEGGYKVGDVIKFKPADDNFGYGIEISVTVVVPEGKKDVTFDMTTVEASYKNDAGMTAQTVTEAVKLTATYTDKTTVTVYGKDIEWAAADTAKFDGKTTGEYTINGTWTDIYGHTKAIVLNVAIAQGGATKIEIKNSATAVSAITSLTMSTLSAKTVYAVLTPADAVDTITWSSSNTAYATVTASGDKSATIKTKNSSGRVTITATTGSGVSASLTLYVNSSDSSSNSVGPYKNSSSGNSLLPSTADDIAAEDVIASSPFTDLEGYNWAATQIETMRLLGVVSGKTASTFAPADNVTRAEFLAMLVRLFNFEAGSEVKEFTDVSSDEWFYDTVKIASSLKIAYGYENGAFDPNAVITREDMAVFAKRALDVAGIKPDEGLTSVFEDDGQISDYAHDAVLYMSSIGVINGMGDGTFAPVETANRAQAAVVVYNLYIKK